MASDWKSRSRLVEPAMADKPAPAANDWRSRSKVVPAGQESDLTFALSEKATPLPQSTVEEPATLSDKTLKENIVKPGLAALQGLTYNFGDEAVSAAESAKDMGMGALNPFRKKERDDAYRARKAQWEPIFEESTRDNFWPYLAGAIASPNPASKAGALARVLSSGGMGALAGLGGSKAELGSADSVADTAIGGGLGTLGGLAGEGLRAGVTRIKGGAARMLDEIRKRFGQETADQVMSEVAQLEGKAGGETTKGSLISKNLKALVEGVQPSVTPLVSPAMQGKAMLALTSPEAQAMTERIAENNIEQLPKQLAAVEAARAAASAARSNAPQETAKRVADYFGQNAYKTELAPRFGRLAQRAALGAVGGGIAGGAQGVMGGLMTGNDPLTLGLAGIGLGAAGGAGSAANANGVLTILRNANKSPLLQTRGLESLTGLANKVGPALTSMGDSAGRELTSEPFDPLRRALMEYFRRQQPQEPTQ